MFDDLKIRNKLVLLMAGPIVIILLLSALGARDRRASASDSRHVASLVAIARANSDVVDALQQESLYSSAYVGSGRKAWEKELKAARANTDTVMAQALPGLTNGLGGTPAAVQSAAKLATGAADKLSFFRDSVNQGFRPEQVEELVVNYADLESTFNTVNTAVADAVSEPKAASELRAAGALAGYKASLARQGSLMAGSAEQGSFGSKKAFDEFQDAQNIEKTDLLLLNSLSGVDRKGAVRDAMASNDADNFDKLRTIAAEVGAKGKLGFEGKAVTGSTSTVIKDLHTVESGVLQNLINDRTAAKASAERASTLFLAAALMALVSTAAAAVFLGRRITRPLTRLTEAADQLSTEQMPRLIETLKNPTADELSMRVTMTPIPIDSNDEIGRLAASFNEVQRVAGEVAEEQAQLLRKGIGEMFVNLARRNQALLDRQIEFIDELERGEEDPDQLDNLYKLDHLATRMRRNAESLLVLAGAEPPRRRGRPAPLANVVRAALAEVEDFGRIELLSFDEVLVASNAAADLAHLLSELMENATNFSPPETRVEVVGHKTKADGYVISVTDHGIGMSAEQIAEANDSLARPPLVGLAMSRSLGFIVVGRLASRHRIAVRMMPSAAGGVTAVVSIPPSLVVDTPGGMLDPEPRVEAPARLKQVLDSPTTGLAPLSFNAGEAPAPPTDPFDQPAAEGGPAVFAPPAAEAPALAPAANTPPPAVFAPPSEVSAAAPGDTPGTADLGEPVAWPAEPPAAEAAPTGVNESTLPTRSIFDLPPEPDPIDAVDTTALAAEVDEAVAPAVPAALSFAAPEPAPLDAGPLDAAPPATSPSAPLPPSVETAAGARLDGPPPKAPTNNRPFFLEDAEPPRAFGVDAPAPSAAPPAPPAAAPAPPRLFGGPAPAPAAVSPPAVAPAAPSAPSAPAPAAAAPASAPPVPRIPSDSTPPRLPSRSDSTPPPAPAAPVAEAPAAPTAPSTDAGPSGGAAAPTTSAGLKKRVPRSAGGSRAIPGSEVERNVGATRRSPEEIRNMLSQHSAGRQRARTQEPVPAGASDERETHE